jgi:hypothetical protein
MRRPGPRRDNLLLTAATLAAVAVGVAIATARSPRAATTNSPAVPQPPQPTVLDRRAPLIVLDPMPLAAVVERLEALYAARVEFDWDAVREAGLALRPESHVLVELRLRDVTLRQALAKVIQCLPEGNDLSVEVAGGDARVLPRESDSPPDAPQPQPVARLYDVKDLSALAEWEGGLGVNSAGGVYVPPPLPAMLCFPPAAPQTSNLHLQYLVSESVAPDTWRDAGSSSGVIWVVGDKMVVVQTPQLHREIEQFLSSLRALLRAPYEKGVRVAIPRP